MAKLSSTKNNSPLKGTNSADTLTVKHSQITVKAGKGNDTVIVNKGSKHKIYGEAGNDKITIAKTVKTNTGMKVYGDDANNKLSGKDKFVINAGKKNYFYGGKGTDTFTVNGGTSNYLYGGAGTDTFVIGSASTGTAIVKDFTASDKVQVIGNTSSIAVSKKNMIIKGGKSGKASLTLTNAKGKKFTVTDNQGSYFVNSSNIALTLTKYFKGTLSAPSFITNIDARKLEFEKSSSGYDIKREVDVTGNAKANTVYVANIDGGTYQGGAGKDTMIITSGNNHIIYGDDKAGKLSGNDTITVKGGSGHNVYGGAGSDIITVEKSFSVDDNKTITIDGGAGVDTIHMYGGGTTYNRNNYIFGGNDNDRIYLYDTVRNYIKVNGGNGNDTIEINGGNNHTINGDAGDDNITLKGGSSHTINGGSGINTIKLYSGKNTVNGGEHKDKIYLYKGVVDDNTINAGNGNDEIYVYDGKHRIYAGDGNDVITISGGVGETYNLHYVISGDAGEDIINITNGEQFRIKGGIGKDTINISAGSNHIVENGGGDDSIYIKSGAGDNISITGNDASAEYVEINAGDKHTVKLGNGENKVLITTGKEHKITTGTHKDVIIIQNKAHVSDIATGGGNDEVTIKDGAYVNNFVNNLGSISLRTGAGNDTITVEANAGDNSYINAEDGDDIIVIKGGNEHHIFTGKGEDAIEITGGKTHTIKLGEGENVLTVSAKGSTISTSASAKDNITINWNKGTNNGTYTIDSVYDSTLYGDTLTIKGAVASDFHITLENQDGNSYSNKRLVMSSDDGDIVITNWFRTNQGSKVAAFAKTGIIFSNGGATETLNYSDIS